MGSRVVLPATDVTAGSNAVEAEHAIDDDELSTWKSRGRRENARLRFDHADQTDGRSVTITLSGVTHVEDAFGEVGEITGERRQSDREGGRDHLELLDVELYAPES